VTSYTTIQGLGELPLEIEDLAQAEDPIDPTETLTNLQLVQAVAPKATLKVSHPPPPPPAGP
jgi:hypothetical protein